MTSPEVRAEFGPHAAALDELYGVQLIDNTPEEAAQARIELEGILARMADAYRRAPSPAAEAQAAAAEAVRRMSEADREAGRLRGERDELARKIQEIQDELEIYRDVARKDSKHIKELRETCTKIGAERDWYEARVRHLSSLYEERKRGDKFVYQFSPEEVTRCAYRIVEQYRASLRAADSDRAGGGDVTNG